MRAHPEVEWLGCWAHARRRFFAAANERPKTAERVLRLIGGLYELEAKWDEAQVGNKRAALRQEQFAAPLRRLRWLVTALQARVLPKSGLGQACTYLLGHWQPLTAHLRHSHTRLDTNAVENAIRPSANCLRKLRLLFEDFPRSHNLVLIGQPPLMQTLALSINEEIRSRVTYSVILPRLAPETIEAFILAELDRAGLGHNTFTADALALVVRSGEGLLRRTKNLCVSALIEAVRDQTRTVDLKQVNRVLIQPHWRKDCDAPLN